MKFLLLAPFSIVAIVAIVASVSSSVAAPKSSCATEVERLFKYKEYVGSKLGPELCKRLPAVPRPQSCSKSLPLSQFEESDIRDLLIAENVAIDEIEGSSPQTSRTVDAAATRVSNNIQMMFKLKCENISRSH